MKNFRIFLLIPLILLSLCLVSCGEQALTRRNADGTKTVVRYRSAVPFERVPYYEYRNGALEMEFNGIVNYKLYILSAEEAAVYAERLPIARSSNLTVYENPDDEVFPYLYLLDLAGTDDSYILFVSSDDPAEFPPVSSSLSSSDPDADYPYALDYTMTISYHVGKTETVPDFAGIASIG